VKNSAAFGGGGMDGPAAAIVLVTAAILVFFGYRYVRAQSMTKFRDLEQLSGQTITIGANKLVSHGARYVYKVKGTVETVEGRGAGRRLRLKEVAVDPVGFAPDQAHVTRHGIALSDIDWIESEAGRRLEYSRSRERTEPS
jgi:hypothetical protein